MKKTMLTYGVLDAFEEKISAAIREALTEKEVDRVEFAAYCACMGAESDEKAEARFWEILADDAKAGRLPQAIVYAEKENETMTQERMTEIMFNLRQDSSADIARIYDYSDGYISDILFEIADGETSIYYADIARFIADHVAEVEDYINEFGWNGDLNAAAQGAECLYIEREYEEDRENLLLYWAMSYIRENFETFRADVWNKIADRISYDYNSIDKLEEIADIIAEEIEDAEEDEDGEEVA